MEPGIDAPAFDCHGNVDRKREGKVDVNELLDFIFPKSLQHPLSTGRLYAFGMYGPLDENANLRAGHNGKRVVSAWEIDTMCLQFEREDILQVYISGGRPLFVLSEAQKEEVIAQADGHLKTAKGRGYRRQITQAEVVQLLSDLPHDEATGLVSFHDAQRLILGYRKKQIARFKVIFPDIVTGAVKKSQSRCSTRTLTANGNNCGGSDHPTGGAGAEGSRGGARKDSDGANTPLEVGGGSSPVAPLAREDTAGRPDAGGRRDDRNGGGSRRRPKFSADVAPAEMFVKDVGFTPAGMAKHTSKLLSTRAYKVGNIADGNDPNLTQNVRLIREDKPLEPGREIWNPYACLRGKNIGALVNSARSSTTAKRKA